METVPNPFAACGLVARVQDEKNYYLAAANAHDERIDLYVVKEGHRTKIGGAKAADLSSAWHQFALSVKGDFLSLSFDRNVVYEAHDKTFAAAGRVGMWTFVNSLTAFDDFSVAAP